jgi:GxxExxY protein
VHTELGPGLLESVYEVVLADKIASRGFRVERQRAIPICVDGKNFVEGFRADLLVEEQVLVEIKSVEQLAPVHKKQVMTYLRLTNLGVGLLINFGASQLKGNIERLVVGNVPDLKDSHGEHGAGTERKLETASVSSAPSVRNQKSPIALGLPHREPFIFVDEVTALENGVSARGVKTFHGDEAFFAGQFPGEPIVPGVILTEALAQMAGIAATEAGVRFLLSAVRVMKFHRAVRPGEQIELEATKAGGMGGLLSFDVNAVVGADVVAEGQIILSRP